MLLYRHRLIQRLIFSSLCEFLYPVYILCAMAYIQSRETAAEENTTAYFPLLDRIADGTFDNAATDHDLYERFLNIVHDDGHLRTPESLSSFKLSLAVRSAAPRISAHYQFYNTSVQHSLMAAQDAVCPVWAHLDGKQFCSPAMELAQQDVLGES